MAFNFRIAEIIIIGNIVILSYNYQVLSGVIVLIIK